MTCLECKKELSYLDHRKAIELFEVELCEAHRARMVRLMKIQHTPVEAIILYYALKRAGVKAMLAWWDGKRTIDLAVSRVKLNIEIERGQASLSYEQALEELDQSMYAYQDGFTTLRIPDYLVKTDLKVTVESILGIIKGLKPNLKVV